MHLAAGCCLLGCSAARLVVGSVAAFLAARLMPSFMFEEELGRDIASTLPFLRRNRNGHCLYSPISYIKKRREAWALPLRSHFFLSKKDWGHGLFTPVVHFKEEMGRDLASTLLSVRRNKKGALPLLSDLLCCKKRGAWAWARPLLPHLFCL